MARTKLENILIQKNLSQTDLYEMIGTAGFKKIGKDRINRYVTGVTLNYKMNVLVILCTVLGCTPNDIVEYEDA